MKLFLTISFVLVLLVLLVLSTNLFAQEVSRELKFRQVAELNAQIRVLEDEFLLPSPQDSRLAKAEGFEAVRLMPRENFDGKILIQGGGSYFSFTTGSHDYQKIAQIGLEQNSLKVGFAGADYGFLFDLGEVPLSSVSREAPMVAFLISYRPPTNLSELRKEQSKAHKYETESGTLRSYVKAVVGHTYVLRAITFDSADALVALSIIRKDTDGSLICFWRKLETFEKPVLIRDKVEN